MMRFDLGRSREHCSERGRYVRDGAEGQKKCLAQRLCGPGYECDPR